MSRVIQVCASEKVEKSEVEDSGVEASAAATHGYFGDVVRARLARRAFLKGATAAGVGTAVMPVLVASSKASAAADPGQRLTFEAIAPSGADAVIVPEGYLHEVVIAWGDPLSESAPQFDSDRQTVQAQRAQFGFNCDFVASFPLPRWIEAEVERHGAPSPLSQWWIGLQFPRLARTESRRALLWVNHEYTSGGEMFLAYDENDPSAQQVDIELAAHGGSLVALEQGPGGVWRYMRGSAFNRRITGETRIELTGPLAGHPLLQTGEDPSGRLVRGMFNNCGGGITPWGTVLSAEENFDQYFANGSALAESDPAKANSYARLPAPGGASERKWERFHPRFDLAVEPNEYARFGYVVEVDPYDPGSTPRKHTALGRFKHEAAVPVIAKNRKVVVYSGDDARFEYVYKFISEGAYQPFDRRGDVLRGIRSEPGQPDCMSGQPRFRRDRKPLDRNRRRAQQSRVQRAQRRHLRGTHRGRGPRVPAPVPERRPGLRSRQPEACWRRQDAVCHHPTPGRGCRVAEFSQRLAGRDEPASTACRGRRAPRPGQGHRALSERAGTEAL